MQFVLQRLGSFSRTKDWCWDEGAQSKECSLTGYLGVLSVLCVGCLPLGESLWVALSPWCWLSLPPSARLTLLHSLASDQSEKPSAFFCQKRKKWNMLRLKFSSFLFLRKHFQDFCIISAVWAHSNFKYIPTNLRIKTRPVSMTPHIPVCKPWLVGKLNSFSCWLQRKCSVALNHSPSYIFFSLYYFQFSLLVIALTSANLLSQLTTFLLFFLNWIWWVPFSGLTSPQRKVQPSSAPAQIIFHKLYNAHLTFEHLWNESASCPGIAV